LLAPDQEVSPKYLRTLRQTLNDVVLPELQSPAGRNTITLCDYVLTRMITALEAAPALQAAHLPEFAQHLAEAARLSSLPQPGEAQPAWAVSQRLQAAIPALFANPAPEALHLLAGIGATESGYRKALEAANRRAAETVDPIPQALLVTAEAVQLYLDQRFPGEKITLCRCYQIPGGRSKLTVLLAVEPNARLPEEMVIRIDAPGSAIATTVLDEFPVLDIMYKAGIAAPEPLWVESAPQHLGAPFLVMRRMPGEAAGDLWGSDKVDPAIGLALAEALAGIHTAEAAAIYPAAPRAAREAVAQMLERFESSWRAGHSTPSLAMECAYGWLRQHLSCINGPTVVVHGDAHFANLLAQNNRLVCLLDWEFVHPGHPAEDLAYCQPYIENIMPWGEFMAHYQRHGGGLATQAQLDFFGVWGYLRNITFGANMLRDIAAEKVHGVQSLAIALNTRARLESLLAAKLASALARDAQTAVPAR
jgi:aminoglycoside phosphotransferase (APT) family kinase protein